MRAKRWEPKVIKRTEGKQSCAEAASNSGADPVLWTVHGLGRIVLNRWSVLKTTERKHVTLRMETFKQMLSFFLSISPFLCLHQYPQAAGRSTKVISVVNNVRNVFPTFDNELFSSKPGPFGETHGVFRPTRLPPLQSAFKSCQDYDIMRKRPVWCCQAQPARKVFCFLSGPLCFQKVSWIYWARFSKELSSHQDIWGALNKWPDSRSTVMQIYCKIWWHS